MSSHLSGCSDISTISTRKRREPLYRNCCRCLCRVCFDARENEAFKQLGQGIPTHSSPDGTSLRLSNGANERSYYYLLTLVYSVTSVTKKGAASLQTPSLSFFVSHPCISYVVLERGPGLILYFSRHLDQRSFFCTYVLNTIFCEEVQPLEK